MTGDQQPPRSTTHLNQRLDVEFALQAAGIGVWELDPMTRQITWDDRCRALVGAAEPGQMRTEQVWPYRHSDEATRVADALQQAITARPDGQYDATYQIGERGTLRWVRFQGRPYFNQTGELVRFGGIAQEVNEPWPTVPPTGQLTPQPDAAQRRQGAGNQAGALAPQSPVDSETRFRTLIEEAPVAICLFVGRQLRIEMANQAMIDIWGKGWSVVDKPLREGLPELNGQPFPAILDQVFTTGETYVASGMRCDLVVAGVPGTYYFDFTYKPLRNAQGEVYAVLDVAVDVTRQVLAGQQLAARDAFARTLFQNSPVANLVLLGQDMVIEAINEGMLQMLGRDRSIAGQPFLVAMPELRTTPLLERLRRVLTTGEVYQQPEERIELIRFGQPYTGYFHYLYTPYVDDAGQPAGVVVTAIEVTAQVLARQQAETSQQQLLQLFEQSPVGIARIDAHQLTFRMANPFYGYLVGRPPQELVGKPLLEALPELVSQGFDDRLREVIRTGVPFLANEVAVSLVRNQQLETIYVDLTYQPLREAGRIAGVFVVATEVTQQVRARQAVEASEAKLRSVIATAPAGIGLFVGRDLVIETPNRTFVDIVGKGWDIVGQPLREAMPELITEGQAFLQILDEVYTTGQMFQNYGSRVQIVQRGVLTSKYYNITYSPLFDEAGQVYAILDIAIDVTGQIQAQQALAESEARYRALAGALEQQVQQRTAELAATNEELAANNEEYAAINEELEEANGLLVRSNDNLQTFAYVASHDLQEPLRKIQQFGDLLQTQYGPHLGDGAAYLTRMQSAAGRMSTLIKDLLSFSRIATRRDTSAPVDLNDVVASVLVTLELVVADRGAHVTIGALPTIFGNASQLNQLFQNLLSNALKFHRPGVRPLISITAAPVPKTDLPPEVKPARASRQYYRIDVADNGIGFEEKYLDRIFQVFQRLHGRNQYAGTGIGLAICEKVVTNHGGAITATSQPGQGATFSIYLPV